MNTTEKYYYTISLTPEHHQIAKKFATQQDTIEKAKQVYLNTLAVFAVETFLEEISFPSELEAGDSWNAAIRCFHNVADLLIPDIGKIECRPVLSGETKISLPVEVLEDRIAYVAVQFEEELDRVQLLGYHPTLDPESSSQELEISQLEPIEDLIDYLFRLELANDYINSDDEVADKVREIFDTKSIPEIVAQLERIYRTCDESDRRHIAGDFLIGLTGAVKENSQTSSVRSFRAKSADFDEDNEEDLTDLAEDLLDKLSEIWGNDN
jgi:hypothetical protein